MKKAVAFSNNDVAFIAWTYDKKIDNCLGFAVYRENIKSGSKIALPAWVGFKNQTNTEWKPKDTSVWPIQKFSWRDLTAQRGGSYTYEIVPMIGDPDNLKEDDSNRLATNQVDLTPGDEHIKAFFNRGILSTQYLAHQIPHFSSGTPDYKVLKDRIDQPGDPLRNSLAGQIIEALSTLLNRVKNEGGECYCALYELNDPEMLTLLLSTPNLHIILSNTGKDDGENKGARQTLHDAGIDISDRMLKDGHIGHNKFAVYVDNNGTPQAVLSGSTNWTYTGICGQSNNAIIIESPELAKIYLDYWQSLRREGNNQSQEFRSKNNIEIAPVAVEASKINIWFSPNTKIQNKPSKNPKEPSDFEKMDEAITNAKNAVLFLVFQPGSPSIIDCVAKSQNNNQELYVRGAATDPKAVNDYNVQLYHRSADEPDTVVAASALKDQFASWQKELLKISPEAHAIIHDKIVVIDPLSDDCTVITGSHNMGYRASFNNDENLLIIRGNKKLAQMYAIHIMDVYDHYRWRYVLEKNQGGKQAFYGLETNDKWQDKYFSFDDPARNDLRIWFQ
jgi:phosphatidylserine/phosphatidylglycerophosphate/cardiolipin synthase-like enzyme